VAPGNGRSRGEIFSFKNGGILTRLRGAMLKRPNGEDIDQKRIAQKSHHFFLEYDPGGTLLSIRREVVPRFKN
jgi:hypothetical protein